MVGNGLDVGLRRVPIGIAIRLAPFCADAPSLPIPGLTALTPSWLAPVRSLDGHRAYGRRVHPNL